MLDRERYPSRIHDALALVPRAEPTVWSRSPPGPLSEAELEHYDDRGFLLLPSLIDESRVEALRLLADLERARPAEDVATIREEGRQEVRSVFAVHERHEALAALTCDATIAGAAAQILADDVYVHQSRINYKPAFVGEGFAWHSDFETWHHEDGIPRMRALSVVVFLTANLDCNGAMMIIPGSHRVFVPCVGETPEHNHLRSLVRQEVGVPSQAAIASLARVLKVQVLLGPPGTVVLFDSNLLHASGNNPSPYDRTNLFFVLNAASNRPRGEQTMKRPKFLASRE